jgi:hypothetical protein
MHDIGQVALEESTMTEIDFPGLLSTKAKG